LPIPGEIPSLALAKGRCILIISNYFFDDSKYIFLLIAIMSRLTCRL